MPMERDFMDKDGEGMQAHLANIVQSSKDAIISKDLSSIVTSWNPGAERLYGYTAEEMVGRSIRTIFPKDLLDEEDEILARIGRGEEMEIYETRRRHKDGHILYVSLSIFPLRDGSGRVIGASSIAQDIGPRRRAEERFRALLESAPDAMVITDEKGRMVLVNAQAERLFGYARGELLGETVEVLMPERFRSAHVGHREAYAGAPKVRPMGAGLDLRARRKDGTEFPVEISLGPLETEEGLLVSAAIRDITERKEAEARLHRSVQEKEVLLQEIHHRVKNNLQVVASLLNIQSRTVEGEQSRAILAESRNRVKSMSLVHEILYRSNEFSRVDLGEYVRQLSRDVARAYGVSPRVHIEVDAAGPPLEVGRAVNVGLIANELITNALKHAFPGERHGVVHVDVRTTDEGGLALVVRDDGVGLPQDLDLRSTGTLGMQVVTTLVDQLRGTLDVESDEGATFTVSVPAPAVGPEATGLSGGPASSR